MTKRCWVRAAMGTTVSVTGSISEHQANRIFESVDQDEARFSRFLPDTELSRFARGELDRDMISCDLRQLLSHCEELREKTNGDFEHEPPIEPAIDRLARAGNDEPRLLDPNAFAKGWIVDRALIAGIAAGGRSFGLNAGGDIASIVPPDKTQRVGIVDPTDRSRIVAVVSIGTGAVATSGRSERGNHLRGDRHTLRSATVVGPMLGIADALATATMVNGTPCPPWWDRFNEYFLLTVDKDGQAQITDGMERFMAHPSFR